MVSMAYFNFTSRLFWSPKFVDLIYMIYIVKMKFPHKNAATFLIQKWKVNLGGRIHCSFVPAWKLTMATSDNRPKIVFNDVVQLQDICCSQSVNLLITATQNMSAIVALIYDSAV